jgi:hypothetical protein
VAKRIAEKYQEIEGKKLSCCQKVKSKTGSKVTVGYLEIIPNFAGKTSADTVDLEKLEGTGEVVQIKESDPLNFGRTGTSNMAKGKTNQVVPLPASSEFEDISLKKDSGVGADEERPLSPLKSIKYDKSRPPSGVRYF